MKFLVKKKSWPSTTYTYGFFLILHIPSFLIIFVIMRPV